METKPEQQNPPTPTIHVSHECAFFSPFLSAEFAKQPGTVLWERCPTQAESMLERGLVSSLEPALRIRIASLAANCAARPQSSQSRQNWDSHTMCWEPRSAGYWCN